MNQILDFLILKKEDDFCNNGKKVGLYFSLFFYTLLFILAYQNIHVWDSGDWLLLS